MGERRGRPPHPDVLTPAEWRVVEQVRDGRTNAEIAVRLGVSVNTVRYHVSNVLAKLELPDRRALARWRGRPRRWGWLVPLLGWGGGAAVAVLVAVGIAVALGPGRDEDSPTAAVAPFDVRASSTEYRAYDPASLRAAGLVDAGQVLDGASGDYRVLYRPGFVVATLEEPAYVPQTPWVRGQLGYGWSSLNAVGITRQVSGTRLYGIVSAVNEQGYGGTSVWPRAETLVLSGPGLAGVEPRGGAARIMFEVTDGAGGVIPSVIDRDGHLWVSLQDRPGPSDVVLFDTGAWLDTSRMEPLPIRQSGWTASWCSSDEACHASSGEARPPIDGPISCVTRFRASTSAEAVYEIASDRFVVLMGPIMDRRPCGAASAPVSARTPAVGGANWSFEARDLDGRALDIAISADGTVYVGTATPRLPCGPCRSGT